MARAEQLRDDLVRLSARVRGHDRHLPDDVLDAYGRIEASLTEILGRAEQLATSPDHLFVVGRTINEYLPTSLETYANQSRRFALTHRDERQRTAHEELLSQLALLERQLGGLAEAVYAGDVAALNAQGQFLQDKFAGSSLDLSSPSQGWVPPQTAPPDRADGPLPPPERS